LSQARRRKRRPRYRWVALAGLLLATGVAGILLLRKPAAPPTDERTPAALPTVTIMAPVSPAATLPPSPSPSSAPAGQAREASTKEPATATAQGLSPEARDPAGQLPFFGVSMNHITQKFGLAQARQAGVQVVRDPMIPWNKVEPVRTDPPTYRWQVLQGLEQELLNAADAGMIITLLILYTPDWAQAVPGHSCGAIRADRLDEFTEFLRAVVDRYSAPPYQVKYWELFNEPDVDPALVGASSSFGCWGDENDEYYGGRAFAEMLKHAYPAIKQADPDAQVILGGLLLDAPDSLPTNFLTGVLKDGGGDYFDLLAFHAYTLYDPGTYNWDTLPGTKWIDWGGVVIGKTTFLREVLREYGYDKPLVLNESGLAWGRPEEPTEDYDRAKADYVVKLYSRGLALGLANVTWFGWKGPGWRQMALLNQDLLATPAYRAYAFAIQQLGGAEYIGPLQYNGLEAYGFRRDKGVLQIVWSADGSEQPLRLPAERFVRALDLTGRSQAYRRVGDSVLLDIRRPMYIELAPEVLDGAESEP
jgi:hypothetical protein